MSSELKGIYDIEVRTITGETTTLAPYRGQVLLLVNTASACGLTPHYAGLQRLYSEYKEQGFAVLGFPCNQFAEQEPGTEAEIQAFCETNYQVTFPLFAKIDVNGENAHPLYRYLREHTPSPYDTGDIEWNFVKFLVDREGTIVKRYSARTEPAEIEADIRELLESAAPGR
ncbi:glutathione peroxidase [Paenibacillus phocaensis]|uniref:glutathione peroxidase n=1 Tax=Paenibacillus phocaensis TaxID=1776378 RepID=UPI000839BE43|nr:glutathione peroxidase [Paenibacillus phocaensis]